jgi:NADH-quinone oxidoreductase subunit J
MGTVQAIGAVLYTDYLLPFELASVLLLVGMIGAVVLARPPE